MIGDSGVVSDFGLGVSGFWFAGARGGVGRKLAAGGKWGFTDLGLGGIIGGFGSVEFRHSHSMPI